MISGIVTGILLVTFGAITFWAWSSRQRERFSEASRLPLDDELSIADCRLAIEKPEACGKSTIDNRQSEMP